MERFVVLYRMLRRDLEVLRGDVDADVDVEAAKRVSVKATKLKLKD